MTRRISLVLGILLAAGAFIGVLVIGMVSNPSPYHVVVSTSDLEAGTIVEEGLFGVDPQQVSPQVAQEYILAGELQDYVGATLARNLVPGQPLMHRDVVRAGNPAAQAHLALALEDPNLVAMVLPVDGNCPEAIQAGDRIAIAWSVGEAGSYVAGNEFDTAGGTGIVYNPEGGVVDPGAIVIPGGTEDEGNGDDPSEGEDVVLPLAKTIIHIADVISVRREQESNPSYTGEEGESPYIEGDILVLDIVIPWAEAEAVQFAVANGEYSVVVLSPNVDAEALIAESTAGIMWQDVLDWFQADRQRQLGTLPQSDPVRPAGAADIYGDILRPEPTPQRVYGGGAVRVPTPATPGDGGAVTPVDGAEDGDGDGEDEVAEVTPTPEPSPTPMPTATAVSEAGASSGEGTSDEEPGVGPGSGESLSMNTGTLLTGVGCVAGVVVLIAAAIYVVLRIRRQRSGAN